MTEPYSDDRRTAIHETGHAAMMYRLGWSAISVSVEKDGQSHGRAEHGAAPDIDPADRTEQQVMILVAGGQTEKVWATGFRTSGPSGVNLDSL